MKDEVREAIVSSGQILGALFLKDPKDDETQPLFDGLKQFTSFEEWPFGRQDDLDTAHELISVGVQATQKELACEYQRLFIGPHHFEAPAWGSVYLDKDQALFGSSLLELRQWMRENGIVASEDKREPEDHIGKMLALTGWLAKEKPDLLDVFLAKQGLSSRPRTWVRRVMLCMCLTVGVAHRSPMK
jgi:TorA maturation chaperone TorD